MNDDQAHKIGVNEAMFRQVNERIEDLATTFALQDRPLELICECGDASCTEQITIAIDTYEAIRKDPTLFVVYPKHEIPDVEEIVEQRSGYDVIRKHEGEPARLARETDSRH